MKFDFTPNMNWATSPCGNCGTTHWWRLTGHYIENDNGKRTWAVNKTTGACPTCQALNVTVDEISLRNLSDVAKEDFPISVESIVFVSGGVADQVLTGTLPGVLIIDFDNLGEEIYNEEDAPDCPLNAEQEEVCLEEGVCPVCGIDWGDDSIRAEELIEGLRKHVREENHTHEDHEDCLICHGCHQCREDLDEDDFCIECGGKSDHDLEFTFYVDMKGTGRDVDSAWEAALKDFEDRKIPSVPLTNKFSWRSV